MANSFEDLFSAEIEAIQERRQDREKNSTSEEERRLQLQRWTNENGVLGLAISGGGIRSATFGLGVIQALAEERRIQTIDYLSTVSGGGYIGAWLLGLFKRCPGDLNEKLSPPVSPLGASTSPRSEQGKREIRDIIWLREFSNYLAPRLGLFSADVWAIFTIWLRNTLLNQLIIVALFGALLLIPRGLLWLFGPKVADPTIVPPFGLYFGGASVLFSISVLWICGILFKLRTGSSNSSQKSAVAISGLLFASSILAALSLWNNKSVELLKLPATIFVFAGSLFAALFSVKKPTDWQNCLRALAASAVATGVFALGLQALGSAEGLDNRQFMLVAPSSTLLLFGLQVILVLGLLGRAVDDIVREWWARVGAWLCILAGAAAAWFGAALWGGDAVQALGKLQLPAVVSWIGLNVFGVSSSNSAQTSGKGGSKSPGFVRELAAKAAPLCFAVGLVLLVSFGVEKALEEVMPKEYGGVLLFAGLTIVFLTLSYAVDVNHFSMHSFYRNRLVRCYLGASNTGRKKDALTNLAANDDLPLADLRADQGFKGPVAIINGALNLASPEPGKQERRADSFVFGPYYCGFGNTYRPTSGKQGTFLEEDGGVSVGHAITVSGAAASPNMGYHTSTAVALLMTAFNVRLGWWFPNPAGTRWTGYGPHFGGGPLFQELFALADDKSDYIYVSDGGHFENLAVYELLRRRCRFIICSDAEEDASFTFGGLGGLIQKARADFGIEIDIDTSAISNRDAAGHSKAHCAVGTIWYPEEGLWGTLLYLKASVTGDEPGDILQYQSANKAFPHQTTGDQFFSEAQFESYRRLGYHVAMSAFRPARKRGGTLPAESRDLFLGLEEAWAKAPRYDQRDFTTLTSRLDAIMERLRTEPDLSFLVHEFYVQWDQLAKAQKDTSQGNNLKQIASGDQFKSSFLFCHSLIQLMEDAYTALNLEVNYEHPDVHGWMNLFRHWAASPRFQLTFSIVACTFGTRFLKFCDRMLSLTPGQVVTEESVDWEEWNPVEKRFLTKLRAAVQPAKCKIYAIRLQTGSSVASMQTRSVGEASFDEAKLTIGFAVTSTEGNDQPEVLRWIRVQNHLRRMGHGRAALRLLRQKVGKSEPLAYEDKEWCEIDTRRDVRWVQAVMRTIGPARNHARGAGPALRRTSGTSPHADRGGDPGGAS